MALPLALKVLPNVIVRTSRNEHLSAFAQGSQVFAVGQRLYKCLVGSGDCIPLRDPGDFGHRPPNGLQTAMSFPVTLDDGRYVLAPRQSIKSLPGAAVAVSIQYAAQTFSRRHNRKSLSIMGRAKPIVAGLLSEPGHDRAHIRIHLHHRRQDTVERVLRDQQVM